MICQRFIATSNHLGNIPVPLRDRLEIVELSSYTEYEKLEIAKRHLVKKQLELHGLSVADFSITDEAILSIIREYTREAGVRELERHIGSLIRKAIKNILMGEVKRVDITPDNIEEYLGKKRFTHNIADKRSNWSRYWSCLHSIWWRHLAVEVTYFKGDGRLVLTGKLGDVMKESAQAALSYVKSNCDKFDIPYEKFKENDIHPRSEGAIRKMVHQLSNDCYGNHLGFKW